MKKCRIVSIFLAAAIVVTSVNVSSVNAAKKAKLSKANVSISVGETFKLSVKNGSKNAKVTWKTSKKSVVKIAKKSFIGNKAYAQIKGLKAGNAKITASYKLDKKTTKLTCKVKVSKTEKNAADNKSNVTVNPQVTIQQNTTTTPATIAPAATTPAITTPVITTPTASTTTEPAAKPTPWAFEEGTLYKQHFDVTRWYQPDNTGDINGYKHDGFKNNSYALWFIGDVDNAYSTNDEKYCVDWWTTLNSKDYKGAKLNITGEFYYTGTAIDTITLNMFGKIPNGDTEEYPVIWRWAEGAQKKKTLDAEAFGLSNNYGSEKLAPNETAQLDITFTLPEGTNELQVFSPYAEKAPIWFYFSNKPDGTLCLHSDNIFYFKNFCVKVVK